MNEYNHIIVLSRGWPSPSGFFRTHCCLREGSMMSLWGPWRLWVMDGQKILDIRVAKNRIDMVDPTTLCWSEVWIQGYNLR